jgi:hypothetical protein
VLRIVMSPTSSIRSQSFGSITRFLRPINWLYPLMITHDTSE